MKQEDKELLLKDLCARLPYRVKINMISYPKPATLRSINPTCNSSYFYIQEIGYEFRTWEENIKPYLRPMSSMTEEEIEILEDIRDYAHTNEDYATKLVDFYNSHYLDYRGLIPLGLALIAPDEMYNVK